MLQPQRGTASKLSPQRPRLSGEYTRERRSLASEEPGGDHPTEKPIEEPTEKPIEEPTEAVSAINRLYNSVKRRDEEILKLKNDLAMQSEDYKTRINLMQAKLDEVPKLLEQAFTEYDARVKAMIPQGDHHGGGSGSWLADVLGIANKFMPQQTSGGEINDMANAIVKIVMKNTLRNVEKALGGPTHVTVEAK